MCHGRGTVVVERSWNGRGEHRQGGRVSLRVTRHCRAVAAAVAVVVMCCHCHHHVVVSLGQQPRAKVGVSRYKLSGSQSGSSPRDVSRGTYRRVGDRTRLASPPRSATPTAATFAKRHSPARRDELNEESAAHKRRIRSPVPRVTAQKEAPVTAPTTAPPSLSSVLRRGRGRAPPQEPRHDRAALPAVAPLPRLRRRRRRRRRRRLVRRARAAQVQRELPRRRGRSR